MCAREVLRQVAGSGLIVLAAGCSGSPTAPYDPKPPTSVMTTFTITNGWTGEPVTGASISANGSQAVTDGAGQVLLTKTGLCLTVDVTAPGFLERRTCSASQITLWPVANAEEREATRTAAFHNDRLRLCCFPLEVGLTEDIRNRLDVQQTWTVAADEIQRQTLGRVSFKFVDVVSLERSGDPGLIIAPAAAPPVCSVAPPWPFETGGFCAEHSPLAYFVDKVNVLPDRLTDGSLALRALLFMSSTMRPHELPGLMNRSRPDHELSTFERKTLHMIGLRNRDVMWPDLEP